MDQNLKTMKVLNHYIKNLSHTLIMIQKFNNKNLTKVCMENQVCNNNKI